MNAFTYHSVQDIHGAFKIFTTSPQQQYLPRAVFIDVYAELHAQFQGPVI